MSLFMEIELIVSSRPNPGSLRQVLRRLPDSVLDVGNGTRIAAWFEIDGQLVLCACEEMKVGIDEAGYDGFTLAINNRGSPGMRLPGPVIGSYGSYPIIFDDN
jgi:hypothetical protein